MQVAKWTGSFGMPASARKTARPLLAADCLACGSWVRFLKHVEFDLTTGLDNVIDSPVYSESLVQRGLREQEAIEESFEELLVSIKGFGQGFRYHAPLVSPPR
jgi:hypothetical protein